jgi:hypothetical protein
MLLCLALGESDDRIDLHVANNQSGYRLESKPNLCYLDTTATIPYIGIQNAIIRIELPIPDVVPDVPMSM